MKTEIDWKLSEKIGQFLKSKEGKLWFASKTVNLDRKKRNELKKRLLDPPQNVKYFNNWNEYIKKELKKDNVFS